VVSAGRCYREPRDNVLMSRVATRTIGLDRNGLLGNHGFISSKSDCEVEAQRPRKREHKSRKLSEIRASANSFRRRNFWSCDCPLGTQSHANPIRLLGPQAVTTFCHKVAWCSPFMVEWTANGNRTDREALMSSFSVKFSGRFCYL
jgi:hypothetical protein